MQISIPGIIIGQAFTEEPAVTIGWPIVSFSIVGIVLSAAALVTSVTHGSPMAAEHGIAGA